MQISPFSQKNSAALLRFAACALIAGTVLLIWGDVVFQTAGILFGASIIAFFLAPGCRFLEKRLARGAAALVMLLFAAALLLGAIAFVLPALMRQMIQLSRLLPPALERIAALTQNALNYLQRQLPGITLPHLDFSTAGADIGETARGAISTLGGIADGMYRFFLMAVLSFFLLSDRDRILLRLELLIPQKWRCAAARSGSTLVRQLRMYLRGQATIALAVGALASAALMILGLQGAPLLGLMVGACNVIPYFGPFLGGIPAVVAALGISWQRAVYTVVALFLVQQADSMLISPRVMGSITGFSPAVVLVVLFIGARIGGIGGMLLALPALMAFRTVYRVFVQHREKN